LGNRLVELESSVGDLLSPPLSIPVSQRSTTSGRALYQARVFLLEAEVTRNALVIRLSFLVEAAYVANPLVRMGKLDGDAGIGSLFFASARMRMAAIFASA
jgi:hypothetical protein